MKHHKGILYDDLMFLSIEYRIIESKKNCKFFKIQNIGCYAKKLLC